VYREQNNKIDIYSEVEILSYGNIKIWEVKWEWDLVTYLMYGGLYGDVILRFLLQVSCMLLMDI